MGSIVHLLFWLYESGCNHKRFTVLSLLSALQAVTPRGKAAAANILNKSRPDYMFYVLTSSSKVVALVIEAKCTATAMAMEHASAKVCCTFTLSESWILCTCQSYVVQDLKNIKNVKGCRDGMPISMQTR